MGEFLPMTSSVSRSGKRKVKLPQTLATRRGIILLYPNTMLRRVKDVKDIRVDSQLLSESKYFSSEFEKWASTVLAAQENLSSSDESDDLEKNEVGDNIFLSVLPFIFVTI